MFLKRRENGWSSGRCAGVARFRLWPLVGLKIISFLVREIHRHLSSQSSVYPFSSTAIIHVRIPVNKNNTEVPRYAAAKSYLASLNYVTLFSPQRDYCCLVGLILNWYTVRMMSRVGLHWGNKTWCFMTHGMNKGPWVFSLILIEILLPSSPGHQCIHNEVNRISKYDLRTFTKC